MILVDAHCDTITKIMDNGTGLLNNQCHLDLQRIQKATNLHWVQFFAAFISPQYSQAYALKRALQIIDKIYEEEYLNKHMMMICRNYNDMKRAFKNNLIAAIISVEGGEALQGDISVLRCLYRLGVRSICLTWNNRNEIADGVSDDITGGGLTRFGRKVIKEMNSLGMLIDVSHIAEKGFWDVIETTQSPIIASHSNARKICNHQRNLTDEQILAIKKNGGVIGINLYPYFLNNSDKASLTDIIKHIEHISSLAGCDYVGIGADFDGIEITPCDITGVQDIPIILNELLKLNYSQESVKKIAGGNFIRVIRQVL
ncbi:MAG TPA: membrane dipeptidase [Clostridiaceae bacterium]|nr:membrane dipeptidase [Clostridiaceae bacterium]